MGAREVVEKDAIELARQKLIAATLGHQDDERFRKKTAVRQLIGTLIAARKRGLSFDRMAGVLAESGVEIATETLRAYYFELKTEAELSAEHEKHAKQLAKIGREIANANLADDQQFAAQAASEHVVQRSASRVRVNAFAGQSAPGGDLLQPQAVLRAEPSTRRAPTKPATATKAPVAAVPAVEDAVSARTGIVEVTQPQGAVAAEPVVQADAPVNGPLDPEGSMPQDARTIDQIATASVGKIVSDLTENIFVRDDLVWYSSGKPFDGFLGAKQLHLLRTVGKVIAPTSGRSSKDFVPMAHSL